MCSRDEWTFTWEAMYDLSKEEKPKPVVEKDATIVHVSSDASYFEISCKFLHYIATWPKIIPYTYIVKWIIDVVDVSSRVQE